MLRRAVLLSVVVASPVMAESRPASPAPVETKSRGATVEGDVYLLTKGGDVKVGAANECSAPRLVRHFA